MNDKEEKVKALLEGWGTCNMCRKAVEDLRTFGMCKECHADVLRNMTEKMNIDRGLYGK